MESRREMALSTHSEPTKSIGESGKMTYLMAKESIQLSRLPIKAISRMDSKMDSGFKNSTTVTTTQVFLSLENRIIRQ